jgi:carboxymethylenebutenolidase
VLGVNDNIQHLALRLAGEGFFAAAPELFHREDKTTFAISELQDAIATAMRMSNDGVIDDLRDTCATLKGHSDVKPGGFGIVGFCLGGSVSLAAAVNIPDFRAVASFYGSRIAGTPLIDAVAALRIPIRIFYGGNDPYIPVEQPLTIYDQAGHGFVNRPDESPANAESAATAWASTIDLFKNNL